MLLPLSVEYALRVMASIAIANGELPCRAQDLAVATKIPAAYLSKILKQLVNAGLLRSERGHRGGFRLASRPAEISMMAVLEAMQQDTSPRRCVYGQGACDSHAPCPLHHRWSAANAAFHEWACNTTLAEIQADVAQLRQAHTPVATAKSTAAKGKAKRSRKSGGKGPAKRGR